MSIYHKTCSVCKESKPVTEFNKNARIKDGYQSRCKICIKAYRTQYKKDNSDRVKGWAKEHYNSNKQYYLEYREARRDSNKEYQKAYYQANKEEHKKIAKEYYEANKEQQKESVRKYQLARRAGDPMFALIGRLRSLVGRAFRNKGYTKTSRTHEMLGCSYDEFKTYIENQFTEGMSWENKSEWHLDHKTPVSWGQTEEEIIALNHYTNFQPLWGPENIAKGNRYAS